jgi:hypothetical protein
MGSSTGNMLVDDISTLERLFGSCPLLIATHCEDEATIKRNLAEAHERYGRVIPPSAHPWIRSREACLLSSEMAVSLAKRNNTRLHILHISTADEIRLFEQGPGSSKKGLQQKLACITCISLTRIMSSWVIKSNAILLLKRQMIVRRYYALFLMIRLMSLQLITLLIHGKKNHIHTKLPHQVCH